MPARDPCVSPLERGIIEGENPVCRMEFAAYGMRLRVVLLGLEVQSGW